LPFLFISFVLLLVDLISVCRRAALARGPSQQSQFSHRCFKAHACDWHAPVRPISFRAGIASPLPAASRCECNLLNGPAIRSEADNLLAMIFELAVAIVVRLAKGLERAEPELL
jgi:hypothetical protein